MSAHQAPQMPMTAPMTAPMTDSHAALVQALVQPACYTNRPAHVEMVQTHISTVFLADEVVYKLKKPVRFSFLDYSTLERRRRGSLSSAGPP